MATNLNQSFYDAQNTRLNSGMTGSAQNISTVPSPTAYNPAQTQNTPGLNTYTPPTTTSSNPVTETTIAQAYSDEYSPYGAGFKSAAETPVDENAIRQQKLSESQAEIDAINRIYADKLSRAKQQGIGRLGESGAIQARRGLLGSDFGTAQTEQVRTYNTGIESDIENEKAMALAGIYSKIKTDATNEIAAKRAAKEAGVSNYLEFLKGEGERKTKRVSDAVAQMIASNVGKDQISSIAKESGLSVADLTKQYDMKQYEAKQAEAKRQQELADKIAAQGPVSLGEGNRLYDRVTGKEIAYNPKTYAPKAGEGLAGVSGGYVPGANPTVDAYVNGRMNGTYKASDIPAAYKSAVAVGVDAKSGGKLSAVQSNIKEAKALVNELISAPGREAATGVPNLITNPFGLSLPSSNARDFKAKVERLNALLFLNAIPQMRGLGALTEREGSRIEAASSFTKDLGVDEATYLKELKRLQKTLDDASTNIGGDVNQEGTPNMGTSNTGSQVEYNGRIYNVDANGEMTPAN